MDKFEDECGIVGVYQRGGKNVAEIAYYGLNGIQHRGQESAGLAVRGESNISCYKDKGLVTDVFDRQIIDLLQGEACLGHVNHLADETTFSSNAQPFVMDYAHGGLAVAFNGGITNVDDLRKEMTKKGAIFTSKSSCELILHAIAHADKGDIVTAITDVMKTLDGAYALGIMTDDKLIGVRDPLGIRPLCVGKIDNGYLIASESCAIDLMGGELIRDLRPGEIVVIEDGTLTFHETVKTPGRCAGCIFEYVYFSRPDSTVDGENVFLTRERAGRTLAQEKPVEADLVIGVPDSGTPAATGYASESGIPYSASMIKNKYVGRTFITSVTEKRERNIKIKLNPIAEIVAGKRIILVDDSIVRGTTMKNIIALLKQFGARSVHVRISSPPVYYPCFFGVDTPDVEDLIATEMSEDALCAFLEADSLEYISLAGLIRSIHKPEEAFCMACFNGVYPKLSEVKIIERKN